MKKAILIFQSCDQKGIIAKISEFIFKNNGNINTADQYSTDALNGYFFLRIEFCFESDKSISDIRQDFQPIADQLNAKWQIIDKSGPKLKMGILVSKPDHCLTELLYHWQSQELNVDIPFILSNHTIHQKLADNYQIPFIHLPTTPQNRMESELLAKVQNTDFLVFARYMQIVSENFITQFGKDIINIHHSFLPSFKGANPYEKAYNRGVKLIGATAHFVTTELDEGPIITQMVEPVTHRDNIEDLISKGKHLEKLTLEKAVKLYSEYKIIRFQNKTIIF